MIQATEFIWMNGTFVPWNEAKVHALTHTLHYGGGTYEGIRAYKTKEGTAIFRLRDHIERQMYSSNAIDMKLPYTTEELCEATCELVRKNKFEQGYIRPLTYYGYGVMGLRPGDSPVEVLIACWPWGKYLTADAVDIKVSKYIRIHPDSTIADAKLCGHYVNSILASLELKGTHYHEALFLDAQGNIAEAPSSNFFIVKDNELLTPPRGTILPGLTRATVIEVAKDLGITVQETAITLKEAFSADEAFFTGTAVELNPIRSIDDQILGNGKVGPVTQKLKDAYLDIVYGRSESYKKFLTYV